MKDTPNVVVKHLLHQWEGICKYIHLLFCFTPNSSKKIASSIKKVLLSAIHNVALNRIITLKLQGKTPYTKTD